MSHLRRGLIVLGGAFVLGWGFVGNPREARAEGFSSSSDDAFIVSAGTAGLTLQTGSPETASYRFELSFGRSLGSSFEFLLLTSYQSVVSTGQSQSALIELDGQLNWVAFGGHADAFYLGARGGRNLRRYYGTHVDSTVAAGVIGKRFSIVSILSYEPTLALVYLIQGGAVSTPAIQLTPLQFTLVF